MKVIYYIELFSEVLPKEAIDLPNSAVSDNLTEFPGRTIHAILRPANVDQVQKIVRQAAQHRIALYAYSSGKNWGQGSRLPVHHEAVLVDLSRLKEIYVDERMEYAIIQAGVTQKELSDYLLDNGIPLKFPVTGSAKSTSVVGNMLDRGASAFFHRRTRLLGVEAITGNGDLVRTGHWHYHQSPEQPIFYAPGVGPDLSQAFCQSNFGIVTSFAIKLIQKDIGVLVFAETAESDLPAVIDQLSQLKKEKCIGEGVLITNRNDPRTARQRQYNYSGKWAVIASFSGITEVRTAIQLMVKETLEQHCEQIKFLESDSDEETEHPYQSVLRDMYNGIPSDYSLQTMAQLHDITISADEEVDENKQFPGMAVALMAVPFAGKDAMEVVQAIRGLSEEMDLQTFYNFATLDDHTFEGFFRVYFDRNDEEAVHHSQLWRRRVHEEMERIGVFPYRMNVEEMAKVSKHKADGYWQAVSQLKKALDPANVIAKGRYCPDWE